ncbi:NADH-quinone oxidoreductase subunit L [Cytophagales bacterium LB-30]|uniref:NADH-quinone oxidoreductase subunit L n=1 Tax=Shiella aurantiaca TaxID=3058365 RepID=A0ABT8F9C5_9BACT|nr:NADH-quinone oxidoreductase subunit L [Shiella aurantiaca]MDN4167000.1 NADH-quinone oxidoreductase subunit L [Shiella aurantiaca]
MPQVQTLLLGLTSLCTLYLFVRGEDVQFAHPWIALGDLPLHIGFWLNDTARWMLLLVQFIAFLVILYSQAYMAEDRDKNRYFAYLGLFVSAMSLLVVANHFLLLFLAWELVGFSSYLLIGFWWERPLAAAASRKAFLLNRVGDIGLIVALGILFSFLGDIAFSDLAEVDLSLMPHGWQVALGFALLAAVAGKSAQFPLQVWLPDAMQGPTPASALIHAATMVAAGVYLLVRVFPLFTDVVLDGMLLLGTFTALIGALSACVQTDIKKVLAYSTVSQLGMMVAAVGAGAPSVAFLHLTTHAFFKAALFLAAGTIIHGLHHVQEYHGRDVQDMRLMGGLGKLFPITRITFIAATLSITAFPFFSGFVSKEYILLAAWSGNGLAKGAFIGLLLTSLLTAYYMFRQVFMIFYGRNRLDAEAAEHSLEPISMRIPLLILGAASTGFFFAWNPFQWQTGWLFGRLTFLQTISFHHTGVLVAGLAATFLGSVWAFMQFKKSAQLTDSEVSLTSIQKTLLASFYWDAVLTGLYRKVVLPLSRSLYRFDKRVIDGIIHGLGKGPVVIAHINAWLDRWVVDGILHVGSRLIYRIGKWVGQWQRGTVSGFLVAFVCCLLMLMVWLLF